MDQSFNIVGFAVEDRKTVATLQRWASEGNGSYFDANDGKSLSNAFSRAVAARFEVLDAQKNVVGSGVVGGLAVELPPGNYTVTLSGAKQGSKSFRVQPKRDTVVSF